jgi:hypothetical protein
MGWKDMFARRPKSPGPEAGLAAASQLDEPSSTERMRESDPGISFGDNVRVRSTPITEQTGLAGLVGQVFGWTTPSVSGAKVVGNPSTDYAISVFFEEPRGQYWFASDLLEFVGHAPGTEARVIGAPKKWTRSESGEWIEERLDP